MEVFKGTTNHWQTDTDSMLNIECSALLGGKRNATVRAVTDRVEVLVLLQKDLIMLDQACVAGIETLAKKRRESNSRREEEEDEEIVVVEEEEEE
jgi:CRP-like cAMP-binding protein